jgi:hypothetical protein
MPYLRAVMPTRIAAEITVPDSEDRLIGPRRGDG